MRSAVLDTNIWVSAAAFPGSIPDQVVEKVRQGRVRSLVSEPLVEKVILTPLDW